MKIRLSTISTITGIETGISLTSISFSKLALGADSDVVLGIDDLEFLEIEGANWRIKVMKQREVEKFSFKIDKNYETM